MALANGQSCYVIDDFCEKPHLWLELALENLDGFRGASTEKNVGYPGIELGMPDFINQRLTEFFMQHIRSKMASRRIIYSVSRLSVVTLLPNQLQPAQSICHRDLARETGGIMTASVLYLFDQPSLGGTSFYTPKKSLEQTQALVDDSLSMTPQAFESRYGITQTYMIGSNDYFEQIGRIDAKYNRIIFYDGDVYHSADIFSPQHLSPDPKVGRLTLNGFFYCTKNA